MSSLIEDKDIKVRFEIDSNSLTYTKMKNSVNRVLPNTSKLQELGWNETVNYLEAFQRVILAKGEE